MLLKKYQKENPEFESCSSELLPGPESALLATNNSKV